MKDRFRELNSYLYIIIGIAICTSCNANSEPNISEEIDDLKPGKLSATLVKTDFSKEGPFEYRTITNGKIESLKDQTIVAETNGKILLSNARVGKYVFAGQLVIQVDTTAIAYKIERAKSNQFNTEKEYNSQLLGYETLLKNRSPLESETIRKKLRISTGLATAEQEIKEAYYDLIKTMIAAPFSGVIANVEVQQGQYVNIGDKLFQIYDPDSLLLEVKVLESDVHLIKKGMPADIYPISDPEVEYKAHVYEINPYIDEYGMSKVFLRIHGDTKSREPKSPRTLFLGMNCSAIINVHYKNTLVVPKEAVVIRSGRSVVFTIEGNKAKWNYVSTGRDNGVQIEIKDGLKANQKVIISNNVQLEHDALIEEFVDK